MTCYNLKKMRYPMAVDDPRIKIIQNLLESSCCNHSFTWQRVASSCFVIGEITSGLYDQFKRISWLMKRPKKFKENKWVGGNNIKFHRLYMTTHHLPSLKCLDLCTTKLEVPGENPSWVIRKWTFLTASVFCEYHPYVSYKHKRLIHTLQSILVWSQISAAYVSNMKIY